MRPTPLLLLALSPTLLGTSALAADLDIALTSSPRYFSPGKSETIRFDVCNRDLSPAGPARVGVFLSADTSFDIATDAFLADILIDPLGPNECTSGQVTGASPPFGAIYPLGVVDYDGVVPEVDETNNVDAGPLTGSGFGFDVVVERLEVVRSFLDTEVDLVVCNLGPDSSASGSIELYASADAVIESPLQNPSSTDLFLDLVTLPSLAGESCLELAVPLVPFLPGVMAGYVGAILDASPAEVVTTNNIGVTAGRVPFGPGVQVRPEALRVTFDTTNFPALRVEGRACNEGEVDASTRIDIYQSADTTLSVGGPNPDVLLTSIQVPLPIPFKRCASFDELVPTGLPALSPQYILVQTVAPSDVVPEDDVVASGPLVSASPELAVRSVDLSFDTDALEYLLTAEVCNVGDVPSPPTSVEFSASSDEIIDDPFTGASNDLPLAAATPIASIDPGGCSTAEARTPFLPIPPSSGPVILVEGFVGARVNAFRSFSEVIYSDNTASTPALLGGGQDLSVERVELHVTDFVTRAGEALVEVCNPTPFPGTAFDIDLVVSADVFVEDVRNGVSLNDALATSVFVSEAIEAGRCRTLTVPLPFLPVPPPPLPTRPTSSAYLGARIYMPGDGDTRNDLALSAPFGVGFEANLVVRSVDRTTVLGAGPGTFEVELTAEVCNIGFTPSGSFDVDFVLSADSEFETPAPFGGTYYEDLFLISGFFTPSLEPGACASVRTTVPALFLRPAFGPVFVGAVADARQAVPESLESDNLAATGPEPSGLDPNAYVASASWAYDDVTSLWTYRAEVCNDGLTDATAVEVAFVASADEDIAWRPSNPAPLDDIPVAFATISQLPVLRCAEVSVDGPTPFPSAAGPLDRSVLGVVVTAPGDANPADDAFVVTPQAPLTPLPNLVVESVGRRVDGSPATYVATAVVCNRGLVPAPASNVTFATSEDQALDLDTGRDPIVGITPVDALDVGACAEAALNGLFSFPTPSGALTAFLVAVVDQTDAVGEVDEDDNVSPFVEVPTTPDPDLAVGRVQRLGFDPTLFQIRYSVEVCNEGLIASSPFDVEAVVSEDEVIEDSSAIVNDFVAASVRYPALEGGRCFTREIGFVSIPTAAPDGPFVGFRADPFLTVPDGLRSNNLAVPGRIGQVGQEDLAVRSLSTRVETTNGVTERVFEVEVCQEGLGASSFEVALVLSADETIEADFFGTYFQDFELVRLFGSNLAAGACQVLTHRSPGLPPLLPPFSPSLPVALGFVGARVVNFAPDGFSGNDLLVRSSPIVLGPGPDLYFESLREDLILSGGLPEKRVRARVCNDGFTASGAFTATLVLSEDATIEGPNQPVPDLVLGLLNYGSIAPGACRNRTLRSTAPWPIVGMSTEAVLGAVLDGPQTGDLNPTNDVASVAPVGTGPNADLFGRRITATVGTGTVRVRVVVCNYGFTASPATTVDVWASADDILDTLSGRDVLFGNVSVPTLGPRRCRARSVTLPYPYVVDDFGNPVNSPRLISVIDPAESVLEAVESNNVLVSAPVILP